MLRRNIKRQRRALDYTYVEMSRLLGEIGRPIPPTGLRRIEGGQRRVDADDLVAIAIVLETNPNMLLLPPVRGTHARSDLTGAPGETTETTWGWAVGEYPTANAILMSSLPVSGGLRPGKIYSAEERAALRRDSIRMRRGVASQRKRRGGNVDAELAELDRLSQLDPEDDAAWAAVADDPGRPWHPSADLLEGLTVDE